MKDRIPLYPGRVTLTPVSGQSNTYDMERADSPTETGTPLNTANLFSDQTAALYPAGTETVDQALADSCRQVGDIIYTVRKNLGENYLLCDGRTVSKATYPELTSAGAAGEVEGKWRQYAIENSYNPDSIGVTNNIPWAARSYNTGARRYFCYYLASSNEWKYSEDFLSTFGGVLAYGNGYYVVNAGSNTKALSYSADLNTWTYVANNYIGNGGLAFFDGKFVQTPSSNSAGTFMYYNLPTDTIDYTNVWEAGASSANEIIGVYNEKLFFVSWPAGASQATYRLYYCDSIGATAVDCDLTVDSSSVRMAYGNGIYVVTFSVSSSTHNAQFYASKDGVNWNHILDSSSLDNTIAFLDGRFICNDTNGKVYFLNISSDANAVELEQNMNIQYATAITGADDFVVARGRPSTSESRTIFFASQDNLVLPEITVNNADAYIRVK